jgi:hypothetical protein
LTIALTFFQLLVLQVPQLNVPGVIYTKFVRPFFVKHEQEVDAAIREAKTKGTQLGAQAYDQYRKNVH